MKAAYTGWTWITNREPEAAKNQLKQAFQECKFLGYGTVENFAFIRDYYADDPQALVDLTKVYSSIQSLTYDASAPLFIIAVAYFAITKTLSIIFGYMERRLRESDRR